jgi:hypothetical protein
VITMRFVALFGGCSRPSDDTSGEADSVEDTSEGDSATDDSVAFRTLGAAEFSVSWDVVVTGNGLCGEIVATLLSDQTALDAWVTTNLPEQTLDGTVDWSSELVLAATLDCRNGGHPLYLDALVQEEALRADYVLHSRCIDTGLETRDYVVVAIPSTVTGSLDATWSILQDTDC